MLKERCPGQFNHVPCQAMSSINQAERSYGAVFAFGIYSLQPSGYLLTITIAAWVPHKLHTHFVNQMLSPRASKAKLGQKRSPCTQYKS